MGYKLTTLYRGLREIEKYFKIDHTRNEKVYDNMTLSHRDQGVEMQYTSTHFGHSILRMYYSATSSTAIK